ncbi:acyltransferase family protein [Colwellia echini]|uniref:Acyltransferase n=1 Tax=Colwellia echini TaxID=1982103 RepID=A0ABY3MU79_9GAMM|nr:acyltransferase [Colwellia echini]TYK64771.1 acyltransferase [Colwellia echini]
MFLNSFNHFRAIAIIFIVAGHSMGLVNIPLESTFEKTLVNIISGGTFLFVFISGFLFYYVFYKKFQYRKFIVKKIRNIFIPYILLGIAPVFFYVFLKKDIYEGYFLPTTDGFLAEYLVPVLKYYWTGAFFNAYWYITFIMITFICSPLHIAFIRSSKYVQLTIIIILSFISVFIQRPVNNLLVFQSFVFFTPVYLIGIYCSINRESIYKFFKNKEVYLFFTVVFIAYLQAHSSTLGSYHKPPFIYGSIDLMFLQKIIFCLFFMVWLHRFEHINNRVVHTVAATSFAIYFIHPYLLWGMNKFNYVLQTSHPWFVYIALVGSVVVCCICVALVMKKVTPKFSRYIIGY